MFNFIYISFQNFYCLKIEDSDQLLENSLLFSFNFALLQKHINLHSIVDTQQSMEFIDRKCGVIEKELPEQFQNN